MMRVCQLLLFFCFGCTSVFYQPDHRLHYPPKNFGLQQEEISFKSKDGTQLIGWFFPAKGAVKGTIVQFHGNGENISAHYLSLVWLTKEGYNLFTFDYRGYGKSTGEPSQEGTYLDGVAALEEGWRLHQRARCGGIFVVYGQSLGGAIAMRTHADFIHKKETDLVVMDSTFLSYKTVARRKLASHWLTWLFSPLGMVLVSDAYEATDALRENKSRLLVIHDREDPVVGFSNGEEIFEVATSQKDFWPFREGRHIGIFASDTPQNRTRFVEYLATIKAKVGCGG